MRRLIQIMCVVGPFVASFARADAVVIVHPSCAASADLALVRRIFLGKEGSLCSSDAVEALDVDDKSRLRPLFLEKILDKTEAQLRQYWSRLIFTGKATPPKDVGDDAAVKRYVAQNKEAVGLIDAKDADSSVRVLLRVP